MTLLRNLTLGHYVSGSSPVHRLDPRAKLLSCLLGLAATFWPGRSWACAATWPLLAAGVLLSGTPVVPWVRSFRPLLWLLAATVVLHGATTPGSSLSPFPLGPLDLTAEGVVRGAAVAAQLATGVAFSTLLTLTTSPSRLVGALEWLASPLKRLGLPVGEFCLSLLIAVRLLPIFQEEVGRLRATAAPRAENTPVEGIRSRVRRMQFLSGLLLRGVFARADAMTASGELPSGGLPPPSPSDQGRALGLAEGVALGLCAATLAAVWSLPALGACLLRGGP